MNCEASIFLFHRDLRLDDNTGLKRAAEQSKHVIPCFIFDDAQLTDNPYRGDPCVQFMLESIEDLWDQLKERNGRLYLFKGNTADVTERIIDETDADALFTNVDYTPFSRKRDGEIQELCMRKNVAFNQTHDALLTVPGDVLTGSGTPYTVFTPFMRKARGTTISEPEMLGDVSWYRHDIECSEHKALLDDIVDRRSARSAVRGGRTDALSRLKTLDDRKNYREERDLPARDATTHLSAHHKFGTCSIRETYHAIASTLGEDHGLITELYWRDFFSHVGYHFPHVFGGAFRKKYDALKWNESDKTFRAWCDGQTGFPIVDAGMRELNHTGYMHNRVRMVTASFLVKDLHVDWRKGERYFATKLIDYDPAVNNGNWQWAASTGCDAQPYFRIFNPWRQQKRFDPDCTYVKRWIPELDDLEPKAIHAWHDRSRTSMVDYPPPIIDHREHATRAKDMFKSIA